jgi:uncharacterized protein YjbJ (UPF0337 family)
MKASTRDKTEGKYHEVKGKAVEQAGKLAGDTRLEADGEDEKVAGKVQQLISKIEKAVGE